MSAHNGSTGVSSWSVGPNERMGDHWRNRRRVRFTECNFWRLGGPCGIRTHDLRINGQRVSLPQPDSFEYPDTPDTPGTCTPDMDPAILGCNGWNDLDPVHGFHRNDRGQIRFTVPDPAFREIIKRLLDSNIELA